MNNKICIINWNIVFFPSYFPLNLNKSIIFFIHITSWNISIKNIRFLKSDNCPIISYSSQKQIFGFFCIPRDIMIKKKTAAWFSKSDSGHIIAYSSQKQIFGFLYSARYYDKKRPLPDFQNQIAARLSFIKPSVLPNPLNIFYYFL